MRRAVVVAGVLVDMVANIAEAVTRIKGFVEEGRASGRTHQVATINTQFIVNAWKNRPVRNILHGVDLATCDGTPVLWASRILGGPRGERVTGADLVPQLAACAAQNGFRVFLFGARPDIAARAAAALRKQNPELQICGVLAPDEVRTDAVDPDIVDQIKAAAPDILLVALGNPRQEQWISLYAPALGVPVAIGIGGTFDFLAGATYRAPILLQQLGLEWLFRLILEPRRLWRRYLEAAIWFPLIFVFQLWHLLRLRLALLRVRDSDPVSTSVSVAGFLTARNSERFYDHVKQALGTRNGIDINVGNVVFMDSVALGALLLLCAEAGRAGTDLRLRSVPLPLRRFMESMNLDPLLRALERGTRVSQQSS